MSGPSSTPNIRQYLGNDNNDGISMGYTQSTKLNFYGELTPIVQQTIIVAGTDAATTQALANALRTALINIGIVRAA